MTDTEDAPVDRSGDTEKKVRRQPKPKPKLVFSIFEGRVEVFTDGTQWIVVDKGDRSYYTNLESVFNRIMKDHLFEMTAQSIENVNDVLHAISDGFVECRRLAESLREEDRRIRASVVG